jgi:hypothetical protein
LKEGTEENYKKKKKKNFSQDSQSPGQEMNLGSPKYGTEMLNTRQQRSVGKPHFRLKYIYYIISVLEMKKKIYSNGEYIFSKHVLSNLNTSLM